jgi:PTS system N-acetylglucosamine-specific IIC component
MLPVAVLPVAALLLRFGQADLWQFILHNPNAVGVPFIADAGDAIFSNIPMIFAVGIAFGLAGGEGATALAGLVGFLIFTAVFNDFIPIGKGAHNNNMDVLSGILIGLGAADLYRRYHTIRLPDYLGFFGGRRFVPIITGLAAVVLGVIFGFIWQPVQVGINALGVGIISLGPLGPGIYGFLNRLLLPLGLHHIINSYIWFQLGTYKLYQTKHNQCLDDPGNWRDLCRHLLCPVPRLHQGLQPGYTGPRRILNGSGRGLDLA